MSIKVYRIKIEGYVVHQDFFSNSYTGPITTPADWGADTLINEMNCDWRITQTLVDTIEEDEESDSPADNRISIQEDEGD